MHITRVIPLFLRVLYLTSTWEFSWVEGQRTWTVKVWSFGAGKDLWLFGIYIYIRPRLQHHLHVVPGLFEKTKKNKTTLEKQKKPLSKSLGNRGGQPRVSKYCFLFCFSIFLVFSSFFLVFSLGPSSKSHFFSRFYGGISQCFFGFILGAFSKESFFFVFLLCFSGFSNFLLVFVFSFFFVFFPGALSKMFHCFCQVFQLWRRRWGRGGGWMLPPQDVDFVYQICPYVCVSFSILLYICVHIYL